MTNFFLLEFPVLSAPRGPAPIDYGIGGPGSRRTRCAGKLAEHRQRKSRIAKNGTGNTNTRLFAVEVWPLPFFVAEQMATPFCPG